MRLIKLYKRTVTPGMVKTAIVYYHVDWQDYFVRFFINDKVQKLMTYAALDEDDAMARAEWFTERE